jgi:hypothetical protein
MGRRSISAFGEDDSDDVEHVIDEEWEAGAVRRSPRYGRIFIVCVLAGLGVAALHTAVSTATGDARDPLSSQPSGILWTFGVLAVVWGAFALLLASTIVLVLDRVVGRRIRAVVTEHRTIIADDLSSPMKDEVPWWVRTAETERERDGRREEPPGQRPEG